MDPPSAVDPAGVTNSSLIGYVAKERARAESRRERKNARLRRTLECHCRRVEKVHNDEDPRSGRRIPVKMRARCSRRSRLQRSDPFSYRVFGQIGDAVETELSHQIAPMRF